MEVKHGTIALIEEGTPVIALATQEKETYLFAVNVKGRCTWSKSMYYFNGWIK